MMELFCSLIAMVAIEMYIFVKTQQLLYLKLVDFIVCNLYLNKGDERNRGTERKGGRAEGRKGTREGGIKRRRGRGKEKEGKK